MTFGKMLGLLAGNLGVRIGGAILGLLAQIVLARNFSQSDVGIIFLTMSLAAFFSLIGTAGYSMLALTQLPRYYSLKLPKFTKAFHGSFLHDGMLACVATLFIVALVMFIGDLLPGTKLALFCAALITIPAALLRYYSAIANSLRFFQAAYLPDFIARPALLLIYILGAVIIGRGLSLDAVLLVIVSSYFIATALAGLAVRGHGLGLEQIVHLRPSFQKSLRKRALALGVVGLVTMMFADIVTMLGAVFLNHDDLAVLGLTVRLAAIAGFVIQAAQQFVLPDLTEAITRGQRDVELQLLKRLSFMTIITMVLGINFTFLFGGLLLNLFGPNYAQGYWLLVMFIFAQSIRALSGMNQSLLSIAGRQWQSASASLIGIAVFVLSWFILDSKLQLMAPGVALILAELTWAAILGRQLQKVSGRRGDFLYIFL